VLHDVGLRATKCAVAKNLAQDVLRIHRRGHGSFRGIKDIGKGMEALLSLLLTMAA
jgi:hypothetical protein